MLRIVMQTGKKSKSKFMDFERLEEKIGVKFNNLDFLQQALTHRSYLNEHREYKLDHNERLEFLGDAVLELVVTDHLYRNFPTDAEGTLTSWRAALVGLKVLVPLVLVLVMNHLSE